MGKTSRNDLTVSIRAIYVTAVTYACEEFWGLSFAEGTRNLCLDFQQLRIWETGLKTKRKMEIHYSLLTIERIGRGDRI